MKKLVIILITATLILSGCSTKETTEPTSNNPCMVSNTIDITFVTYNGGVNDNSFNESTWSGIEQFCANNEGIAATYIITEDPVDLEQNLITAAEQSEVVVATGFSFAEPVGKVAQEYSDTNFILIDAEPVDSNGDIIHIDNVMSYYFAVEQAGYIVGYIAGKTTEYNHIGFIGGEVIPPVNKFAYGYIQGAQAANPKIEIDIEYANSFDDVEAGEELAYKMYDQGCDIIFSAAGGRGIGAIDAAVEYNATGHEVWAIGADVDQYEDGTYTAIDGSQQSVVLTSAVKNVGNAVYDGLEHHFNNNWEGGSVTTLTIEDGGVGIPEENKNIDPIYAEETVKSLEENIDNVASTLDETLQNITTATINGERY